MVVFFLVLKFGIYLTSTNSTFSYSVLIDVSQFSVGCFTLFCKSLTSKVFVDHRSEIFVDGVGLLFDGLLDKWSTRF